MMSRPAYYAGVASIEATTFAIAGITRIYARQGLVGVTACDKHIPAMAKVVASMLATPA